MEITCPTCPTCPISLRTSKKFQFTCPGTSNLYNVALAKEYLDYKVDIFLISRRRGASNEYPKHMFSSINKKKMSIFGQVNLAWTSGF